MGDILYVGVNGVLRYCKNKFHKPIDGIKTGAEGSFGNPHWIAAEDLEFSPVTNFEDGYKPFQYCRLRK